MLDSDLARLYGIETRELKQAVRRNIKRFPADFMIELDIEEYNAMMACSRSQIVTLDKEDLGAVNDLSEDVRKDIDNLYLAIAELSSRLEEKKNEPRPRIGFQQNIGK